VSRPLLDLHAALCQQQWVAYMLSTFSNKDDFLAAVSSKLDDVTSSEDVRSALVSGISLADDSLRGSAGDKESLALSLKVGAWVIRDDDLPLLQALNATGAAVALSLTTAGIAWPAVVAALTGFADLCWRAWRKGARLSSLQVAVYGFLKAHGPMTVDALTDFVRSEHGEATSVDVVKAVLESLHEVDANDGHLITLASKDTSGVWKALRI
jgi:hypothetical protein